MSIFRSFCGKKFHWVTAVTLSILQTSAWAENALMEEIIVTAERRAESLQDVPMALTAFSGDMISEAGITGIEDVAIRTPNFKMTSFNIAEPQMFLRGIGSTNDSAGSDPAVAVFIDDVYVGRASAASTDLYDLDRIEVLRGPQGTLYGRNAAGGAVSIFSKRPQQGFEAKVGLTLGSESLVNLRGYINGSITDMVAGKLTVNVRQRDGFAKNINTGQDLEDDDTRSMRGQLLITPSDRTEILLSLDYTDIDRSGDNRFITNLDIVGNGPGVPAYIDQMRAANDLIDNDPRKSNHDEVQSSEKQVLGLSARVEVDFDWATLTSITAYRESESSWWQALNPQLSTRVGGLGLQEVDDGAEQDAEQVSQELRLSSQSDNFQWVAGLYYFKEEVDRDERFFTYWDPTTFLAAFGIGDISFLQEATNTSFAAFGQFTWDMSDSLALTLGGRYTDDKKEIDNAAISHIAPSLGFLYGIPLIDPPYAVSADESWSETTLRATIDWSITENHMLYATYSEGFKSGAFIGQQRSPIVAATPILPELATNKEIGIRTEWLDGHVRFNATYFDLDYEDLQVWFLVNNSLNAVNAAAEVSGVETDFVVAFNENFNVIGSYANMDAKFTGGSNTGNDLTRAPDSSWSLSANLTIPFASGASLGLVATTSYTDEYHNEIDNDLRGFEDDVTLSEASARYTSADDSWEVTAWAKNLGDKLYPVHHIDGSFGGATKIYAPPRTYGVTFTHYWK